MSKSFKELSQLETFEERIQYLYLGDKLCNETFGRYRQLNQDFYKSKEWRRVRDEVIARDMGCDLGVDGCELGRKGILVHHINPISIEDLMNRNHNIFDLDNLISVSHKTHNFIHYGTNDREPALIERSPNDTCPWKK